MIDEKDRLAEGESLLRHLGLMLLVLSNSSWTKSSQGSAKDGNYQTVRSSWNWWLSMMTDTAPHSDGTPSPIVTLVGYKFGETILTLTLALSSPGGDQAPQRLLSRLFSNTGLWMEAGELGQSE